MGWGKSDATIDQVVKNLAFFPDLNIGDLQRDYRVPTEHEPETVIHHLQMSMIEVYELLTEKMKQYKAEGHATLDAVPSEKIGPVGSEVSLLVINYKRAVFCKAKALLIMQFESMYQRDIDDGKDGDQGFWFTESAAAVRSFTGTRSRASCEAL